MNYHFAEMLYDVDVKRHIPHAFSVPEGCQRIQIRLRFAPALVGEVRNMLTLTLFDPAGFRGAGHRGGTTHNVELTPQRATPGYLAGVLPAGEWVAQIDTHMVLPGEACRYELDVTCDIGVGAVDGAASTAAPDFSRVVRAESGWYRGDIHAHTVHSDASWTVEKLAENARAYELDFIALTDHNTISPLAAFAQQSTPDLLTLGGMELTTFWGHAVCLGRHDWIDWRVDSQGQDMAAIAAAVDAAGGLFIIAHPKDIGDPFCTGCRWVYPDMMPGNARFVEIWNHWWQGDNPLNRSKNVDGVALWYQWLNAGLRLYATAGTDTHGPKDYQRAVGFNVVYAEELSERGILAGLRAGHAYLSGGPTLHFTAETASGARAMMGDTLRNGEAVGEADTVTFNAQGVEAPRGGTVRLIVNGMVHQEQSVMDDDEATWVLNMTRDDWAVIEVRQPDGSMAAITNPIFFG